MRLLFLLLIFADIMILFIKIRTSILQIKWLFLNINIADKINVIKKYLGGKRHHLSEVGHQ